MQGSFRGAQTVDSSNIKEPESTVSIEEATQSMVAMLN